MEYRHLRRSSSPHRVQDKPRTTSTRPKGHRGTTHSTGHVPTEDNRTATIHREHPTKLYLPARRRTTFTVQSLRRGSVDHERLRNDKHSLPSRTFERFLKNLRILMILVQPNKKRREPGEQGHARTRMHWEADKALKMRAHHVPFRQIIQPKSCVRWTGKNR